MRAAEAGGRDAEAGVAGGVGEPALVRGAEEDAEAAAGVDRAAPAVGEARALELRERVEEVLGELREGRVVLVVARADRAAVAVDGVPAAEQDAAVGGEPVVVELVAAVADALAVRPADRVAGRVERLGDEHVVVDRHDVVARSRLQQRRDRRSWRAGPCGARPRPWRGEHREVVGDVVHGGVLVDADAGRAARRRAGPRRACRGRGCPRRCDPRGRRGRWASATSARIASRVEHRRPRARSAAAARAPPRARRPGARR